MPLTALRCLLPLPLTRTVPPALCYMRQQLPDIQQEPGRGAQFDKGGDPMEPVVGCSHTRYNRHLSFPSPYYYYLYYL